MCNSSTWEDETGGLCIFGQSELHGKIGVGDRSYSELGRLKQEDWEFKSAVEQSLYTANMYCAHCLKKNLADG